MKRIIILLAAVCLPALQSAHAEVNVNVNLGIPAPGVVVAAPPAVLFPSPPMFVSPSRLGFYVGVDTPYDILFSSDYYYLFYGNAWHRSRHHNGPWVTVPYRQLPPGIRKHRLERIREYRDKEYRVYRDDRDHYRGRHFRPDHERREEIKEERRQEREERKHEREERKEEKHRGKHGGHRD